MPCRWSMAFLLLIFLGERAKYTAHCSLIIACHSRLAVSGHA